MKQTLTINQDTFLWTDGRHGLLYDSSSFTSYRFRLTPQISELCNRLMNPDSLYSVDIDMDSIDSELRNFIEHVTEKGMGTLHDDSGQRYLVSFPPLLNIQRSWERIKAREDEAYNEILPYLTSLTFYLGGICPDTDWYRQVLYPICSEKTLAADKIIGFLSDADSPYITDIRIVLSSVKGYLDLHSLLDGLRTYGDTVTLYVRAEDTVDAEAAAMLSGGVTSMALLHMAPFTADISQVVAARHIFLITSEKDYEEAIKWSGDNGIETPEIVPVFNGVNAGFFRDNVFLTEREILGSRLERRAVFAHMAVNTGFFGSLTFMPDGRAYASPAYGEQIGDISDSVYDLITAELERNTAWRLTRDMPGRCRNCLYRYLCPSPSAYEKVMGIDCICTDLKEKGNDTAD